MGRKTRRLDKMVSLKLPSNMLDKCKDLKIVVSKASRRGLELEIARVEQKLRLEKWKADQEAQAKRDAESWIKQLEAGDGPTPDEVLAGLRKEREARIEEMNADDRMAKIRADAIAESNRLLAESRAKQDDESQPQEVKKDQVVS